MFINLFSCIIYVPFEVSSKLFSRDTKMRVDDESRKEQGTSVKSRRNVEKKRGRSADKMAEGLWTRSRCIDEI